MILFSIAFIKIYVLVMLLNGFEWILLHTTDMLIC